MTQLVINRVWPSINCHAKRLMKEDLQRRKDRGESGHVRTWISARADEANISAITLRHIIYGEQVYKGYEKELVKIFGKEVFTVEWKTCED